MQWCGKVEKWRKTGKERRKCQAWGHWIIAMLSQPVTKMIKHECMLGFFVLFCFLEKHYEWGRKEGTLKGKRHECPKTNFAHCFINLWVSRTPPVCGESHTE